MDMYNINLAEEVVPNAKKRKKHYRAMLVYFALVGLLLIQCGAKVAQRWQDLSAAKADRAHLISTFNAEHSAGSVKEYADLMKGKIGLLSAQVAGLDKELAAEVPLCQILFYVSESIPNAGELIRFDYDSETKSIDIEVRLIMGLEDSISQSSLLRSWRRDEDLKKYIGEIIFTDLEENLFIKGYPVCVLHCRMNLESKEL